MLKGLGRHTMGQDGRFQARGSIAPSGGRRGSAALASAGLPDNTSVRAFAKPTGVNASAGLLTDSPTELLMMAREMHANDPVCGSVAETVSNIPFGEFTLSGMPDTDALQPYLKSLERMRIKTLLPALALSYLVDGAHLSTLMFNDKAKVFDGVVPQDLMFAKLYPVPFFGASPIVDITVSPDIARALGSRDPRMQRYLEHIPRDLMAGGHMQLKPENTLYVPRRSRADVFTGTSMFRRVMPIYLLDKALMRGTIEMAYRRQKGILHILAGDENWDPTNDELRETADLFLAADMDPISAVVATRQGVTPQEVNGSEGAWKWTDSVDVITQVKLKGLGMPDGLLGGDMSLDSVGSTLTVFIQQVRQFRDYITRVVLYEKLFAYLAIVNEHRKDVMGYQERGSAGQYGTSSRGRLYDHRPEFASDNDVEMGDYMMTVVSWHNSMRPEGDTEYLALLDQLSQQGVPIPIRMRAASAGVNIEDILNGQDDDYEVRAKMADYQKRIAEFDQQGGQPDQGDGFNEQGRFDPMRQLTPVKRIGLLKREYDEDPTTTNVINGHRYLSTSRHRKSVNERVDRLIARSLAEKAVELNRQQVDVIRPNRKPVVSGPYRA